MMFHLKLWKSTSVATDMTAKSLKEAERVHRSEISTIKAPLYHYFTSLEEMWAHKFLNTHLDSSYFHQQRMDFICICCIGNTTIIAKTAHPQTRPAEYHGWKLQGDYYLPVPITTNHWQHHQLLLCSMFRSMLHYIHVCAEVCLVIDEEQIPVTAAVMTVKLKTEADPITLLCRL